MRRLIASLAISLGMVLANISTVAAARYWELQMFDPAATTNRTVNIEFKVMSTEKSDTFKVELFENGSSKEVKNIATPNGDSGVFSVSLPASGTYTYKIDATNNGNASTDTESRTVQVVDGPTPIVTTVFVDNGAGGGQGAGGTQAAATGGGANTAGGAGAGEVAGAAANEGQVSAEGAATDENNQSENTGDVLGESDNTTASNNRRRNITLGIAAVLAAAGAAYYWLLVRPRNSA